jgi:hypothetical protein
VSGIVIRGAAPIGILIDRGASLHDVATERHVVRNARRRANGASRSTPIQSVVRIVTVSWTCLPAYAAYLAYVPKRHHRAFAESSGISMITAVLSVIKKRGVSEDSIFANHSFSRSESMCQKNP